MPEVGTHVHTGPHTHVCVHHGKWHCQLVGCDAPYDHDCEKCWAEYRLPAKIVARCPFVKFDPGIRHDDRRFTGAYQHRIICALAASHIITGLEWLPYEATHRVEGAEIKDYRAQRHHNAVIGLRECGWIKMFDNRWQLTPKAWRWITESFEHRVRLGSNSIITMREVVELYA